ncbi:MAG: Gfo/Idh/MocA family oxidoreductase [Nitrospirae bacterium]|nr:Gfo/Idh/MocA family oxidoreductase [Nitrospirota bacterium]
MSVQKKFIANIGLGYWGKNILRNLYELGVLHTACDSSEQTIAQRRQQCPDVNFTTSFDEVLENPDIAAVAISSPAVTHYNFVKRSLLAGKDVFVEKPLALTFREGRELVDIAEKGKRILMVGHILQYHPAVRKLKELVASGELGKIQYIYSNRLNIGKLRTEENILWSFAPHDISVILMLLGEEPVNVSAVGGDYLNKGIFDTTLTTLEFRNGVKGHIFVSWLHPYKEQKLIVVGSKAMIVFDDVSKEKLFLYPHTIEWKDGKIPIVQKADYQVVPVEAGEPLRLELGHFADCVTQRTKPVTDGAEGLRVLKILEASENTLGGIQAPPAKSHAPASPSYFAHATAVVDEGARIGKGTRIWHFSHILKGSKIGDNCIIGQNVVIGPDGEVGNGCKIQNNVSVYKGVVLEDGVFCGPSCVFTNVYNPRAFIERKHEFLQTRVKTGATIGANATVVCGSIIGKYSMIGAGAVVKSDVPDYAVVAGVPAKQIGWACRCGTTLKPGNGRAVCGYCGNEYESVDDKLIIIKEEMN